MTLKETLVKIYDVHYKKLMLFSFILLILCIGSLFVTYARTGEFIHKGVSLKGGITMTIPIDHAVDIHQIENTLANKFPQADIGVREITEAGRAIALIVEASDISAEDLQKALSEQGIVLEEGKYSLESMGSSMGQRFFAQTIKALIYAFIFMSIVVYLTFRSIVPSSFIILTAVSDIVSTIAMLSLLNVKISTAGIAALLMLIGYSVDTDILLTTKVLKRKGEGGSVFQRTASAFRTGITMSGTALVASTLGLIFTQSDVVKQIMLIVTIGTCFDIIYTWFQNA